MSKILIQSSAFMFVYKIEKNYYNHEKFTIDYYKKLKKKKYYAILHI